MLFRLTVVATVFAFAADAQDRNVEAGQDLYMTYCWQSHGVNAKGDGPMAEMLAIFTPDLTLLTEENGGQFPIAAVAMQIDGRSPVLAHGGDMPIFGPALGSDQSVALRLGSGQSMMTSLPLANLIAYLEGLQS